MAKTKAKTAADNRWNAKNYYNPRIFVKKEYEQPIKDRASELGTSINGYITTLIKADLGIDESEK